MGVGRSQWLEFTYMGRFLYGAWLSLRAVDWAKMRIRQCLPSLRTSEQVAITPPQPSPREYLGKTETHETSVLRSPRLMADKTEHNCLYV